jgi:26S proteasome regulatory subunit T5
MSDKLNQAPVPVDAAPNADVVGVSTREQYEKELGELSNEQVQSRVRMYENNLRLMRNEYLDVEHDCAKLLGKTTDANEKLTKNKVLPYLVSNIVEVIDVVPEGVQEGVTELSTQVTGKCVIIKTTMRQTIFLPVPGFIEPEDLKPGELVGVNKDSFLIYEKLPAEYDSRIKSMELEEKPTEEYTDIGGLDKQIEELREAVVLPLTHGEKFKAIGIEPPKGLLMHGPPGTGKTMLARACAAQSDAAFLKLAGPQLVQMFIGDGAKIVRDAFALAREKAPTIIFIDELDAIGTKRFDSGANNDREVQRTMLELLNQLDGFSSDTRVKVIAATNRPDILDPALLRSGRLDRKIEFPIPNEEARMQVLQIHTRKMNCSRKDIDFKELARSTEDFNCAQVKAVCVEGGMCALRRNSKIIVHEDFVEGISVVLSKKKMNLNYFG